MLAYNLFSLFFNWVLPFFLAYYTDYLAGAEKYFVLPKELGPAWEGGWSFLPPPKMISAEQALKEFATSKPNRKPGDVVKSLSILQETVQPRVVNATLGPVRAWKRIYAIEIEGPDGAAYFLLDRLIFVRPE